MAASCKKDSSPAPDFGYDYYPVTAGSWIIYDVDSTFYNLFTHQTEFYSFQVKEHIDSILPDNAERAMVRIKRYYRNNSSESWTIGRVWYAVKTKERVERTEENVKFVKLIFPVRKNKTWNGNAMNSEGELTYKFTSVHTPSTIGGSTFDSTATVLQQADSNLIQKKYKTETYAKHVGLIYKEYVDVSVQDTVIDFSKPFEERINTGVKYIYRINSFGK